MKQSAYSIHLELTPKPATIGQYWEQPATALFHTIKIANRRADLSAANKVSGKAGSFLKSAAFKALNNLRKIDLIMIKRSVIDRNIQAVNDAGVLVQAISIFGTVSIRDMKGNKIFLQGDEGSAFISQAKALYDELGDISLQEACEFYAYDYLDLLKEDK